MLQLNYHHLYYFWMIVKEGGVLKASRALRVAQPTVSGQLKILEQTLGEKLFDRQGRKLVLTEVGQLVLRYAEEIFALGRELTDTLEGKPTGRPLKLMVGLTDALPKLVAYRLLEPALRMPGPTQVVCIEDKPDRLLADLALHSLHLVLSDAPADGKGTLRVFSHLLGQCGVAFFGTKKWAQQMRPKFPHSLNDAPVLLPTGNTSLRRGVATWLEERSLRPHVVGEFQDSALLAVFGQQGVGVFPAPLAVEEELKAQYGVEKIGEVAGVTERFYAISAERRLKHPAVVELSQAARHQLFR